MNDNRLDASLSALKKESTPTLGPGFNAGVWTQIEGRKANSLSWLLGWRMPWPALALTGAAFAIIIGVATAFFDYSPTHTKGDVLGMEVFAADASYLPSSLLARIR